MLTFKSPEDLSQLHPDDPAYPLMEELVEQLIRAYTWPGHPYLPEDYGYLILIQEGDTFVADVGYTLIDMPWEGVTLRGDHYYGVFLANDEFGIGFVIPNAPWLPPDVRAVLEYNRDP